MTGKIQYSNFRDIAGRARHPFAGIISLALVMGLNFAPAAALSIAQTQMMLFGSLAIPDNSIARTLTVASNGTVTPGAGVLVVTEGQPATYHITGAPASTALTITAADTTLDANFSGRSFTISNFETDSTRITDVNGELTFSWGARLTTDGGGAYADGPYDGYFVLSVIF